MLGDPVLMLIDLQNDFCKPGYALDHRFDVSHVQPVLKTIESFLEEYRSMNLDPILVRHEMGDRLRTGSWSAKLDDRELPPLCVPQTDGVEFVPEVNHTDSDIVVTKNRYNGFYNTNLELYLRANDCTSLLIGGVSTNLCVESTVRSAYDRGFNVTVLSDCTAAVSKPERHQDTLTRIDQYFGTVEPSSMVL